MKLHVFPASPNARKIMFLNNMLGLDISLEIVDLQKGEQKAASFLALNPNGRMPVLEFDDGSSLWESNAIMNRLGSMVDTPLWPKSDQRYDIMRWQFWEASHWTPAFRPFISKTFFGKDDVDLDAATEALRPFAEVIDTHLGSQDWLSGDAITIADIAVSAPLCYRVPCAYPLEEYANLAAWMSRIESLDAWQKANPASDAA